MKKIFFISLILVAAMLFNHCITPLDVVPEEEREILVVEGGITSQNGPHRILISKSARYGSRAVGQIEPVKRATVRIRSDIGEQVFLTEDIHGSYLTDADFKGTVGAKYTLLITLEDGTRFASLPEEMSPVPELLDIIPEFKEQPALEESLGTVGVDLYAKFNDPPGVRNFYLWQIKGEFEFFTRPDLYSVSDGMGGEINIPLECCEFCFYNEGPVSSELALFTDIYTNGNEHQEFVGFIKDDGLRFLKTYMAVVEQYGMTKESFAFFELLKSQMKINGNIFDPPPATLRGNIINLDVPDEETIGYFFASAVSSDTVFIDRSLLTNPAPIVFVRNDCRVLFDSMATQTIPLYWPPG